LCDKILSEKMVADNIKDQDVIKTKDKENSTFGSLQKSCFERSLKPDIPTTFRSAKHQESEYKKTVLRDVHI
jgi:hypothetical protein